MELVGQERRESLADAFRGGVIVPGDVLDERHGDELADLGILLVQQRFERSEDPPDQLVVTGFLGCHDEASHVTEEDVWEKLVVVVEVLVVDRS